MGVNGGQHYGNGTYLGSSSDASKPWNSMAVNGEQHYGNGTYRFDASQQQQQQQQQHLEWQQWRY
jgi:hypothetical protein